MRGIQTRYSSVGLCCSQSEFYFLLPAHGSGFQPNTCDSQQVSLRCGMDLGNKSQSHFYNLGRPEWQNQLPFKEQYPLFNRPVLNARDVLISKYCSYCPAQLIYILLQYYTVLVQLLYTINIYIIYLFTHAHRLQDFPCISIEMLFYNPNTLTLQRMY